MKKKQADTNAKYSGNLILIAAAADLLEFARILTNELDEDTPARLNAYIPGECLPGQAMLWKFGGSGGIDYIVGDFAHK